MNSKDDITMAIDRTKDLLRDIAFMVRRGSLYIDEEDRIALTDANVVSEYRPEGLRGCCCAIGCVAYEEYYGMYLAAAYGPDGHAHDIPVQDLDMATLLKVRDVLRPYAQLANMRQRTLQEMEELLGADGEMRFDAAVPVRLHCGGFDAMLADGVFRDPQRGVMMLSGERERGMRDNADMLSVADRSLVTVAARMKACHIDRTLGAARERRAAGVTM